MLPLVLLRRCGMKAAPNRKTVDAENAEVVETAGENFADDSGIELVSTTTGKNPQLLLWKAGCRPIVGPRIRHKRKIFVPIHAHPSVWKAMTLPTGIIARGSSAKLLAETRDLFERFVGVPTRKPPWLQLGIPLHTLLTSYLTRPRS
jgi:hypothetical protein